MTFTIHQGDALEVLREMPAKSVHCCVCSPPYWGLRDYGINGQLGLERTPDEYVGRLVEVFREVRRVLRDDGTLWLNLGDSYAGSWSGNSMRPDGGTQRPGSPGFQSLDERVPARGGFVSSGLKPKDLVGIPWRVAFALQADGWWLRSDIIWSKPNPMPESVTDRPTKAHEYIFLLAKSERYFYNAEAIAEPATVDHPRKVDCQYEAPGMPPHRGLRKQGLARRGNTERKYDEAIGGPGPNGESHLGRSVPWEGATRNKRSVWHVTTKPFPEAHFAVYPPELIEPCIKAGCPEGGTVLDPFLGSGTTAMVALRLGRSAVGIELSDDYCDMARARIIGDAPLLNREDDS